MKPHGLSFLGRSFQIWSFTVSHSQLLLRSVKTAEFPSRIDILFKDVDRINLPVSLRGLTVREVSGNAESIGITPPLSEGSRLFEVESEQFVGYVAAGAMLTHEDQGDYCDPSGLLPAQNL